MTLDFEWPYELENFLTFFTGESGITIGAEDSGDFLSIDLNRFDSVRLRRGETKDLRERVEPCIRLNSLSIRLD
jgi:hypothetical protein